MACSVVVIGGLGFIGRHLVTYLVANKLAASIRVVDKVLVQTAYLSQKHKEAFADPSVEYIQANLCSAAGCAKAFAGKEFDYIFNLAAETKYGQTQDVYDEKVLGLSVSMGMEASKKGCKAFVELSTAQVYEADKKPSTEDARLKPWTMLAKSKAKAEEELSKIPGVYGPSDTTGITPRIIIGAVYRKLDEEMKLLWTKDLKMNTVHVKDVVRAIWFVSATTEEGGGRSTPISVPEIYNLCDKSATDQGTVNEIVGEIFGIETGFQGTIISSFAKLNLESIVEDVNEKHLQPWSELLKAHGVSNSPLTPFLDKELLKDNALSVDGSKVGFVYQVPKLSVALVTEIIDDFVASGMWPKGTTK